MILLIMYASLMAVFIFLLLYTTYHYKDLNKYFARILIFSLIFIIFNIFRDISEEIGSEFSEKIIMYFIYSIYPFIIINFFLMIKNNVTIEKFVNMERVRKIKLRSMRKDLIEKYRIKEIPSKTMEKILEEMGFLKRKNE